MSTSTVRRKFFSIAFALCLVVPAALVSTASAQDRHGSKEESKKGRSSRVEVNAPICHHPSGMPASDHSQDTQLSNGVGHYQVHASDHPLPCGEVGGPNAVPEPITVLLFGAGLAGVGYVVRRRKGTQEDSDPSE